jgi:hypothetical protein
MDDDVLSQGGDREPSRWPRRLTVIAVVIAVIAGGAVYLSRPHPRTPAATPRSQISASPTVSSVPPGPSGILGQTLAWDPSLRLPDAAPQPVWFSPATGRSAPIGGLPARQAGYQFTRALGGWAVQARATVAAGCGSCAGLPTPVWFLADGARSVTPVGTANLIAPSATAGVLWLTSYAPGASMATAAGTAREAGAHGPLLQPVTLPPGYVIDRGTVRGLLLTPAGQQPGVAVSQLWDPSSRRVTRTFDHVLAVSPGAIAAMPACSPRCSVAMLSLTTGKHTKVVLPAGNSVTGGSFSPDGKFLALEVSSGNTGDGGELGLTIEVATVASGRLAVVPGTFVSSDALIGFGWPAGRDRLVAQFSFTTKMQLASWQPGASSSAVTVLRPGPNQASLILG